MEKFDFIILSVGSIGSGKRLRELRNMLLESENLWVETSFAWSFEAGLDSDFNDLK